MGEQGLPMVFAADDGGVGVSPVEHWFEFKLWRRVGRGGWRVGDPHDVCLFDLP